MDDEKRTERYWHYHSSKKHKKLGYSDGTNVKSDRESNRRGYKVKTVKKNQETIQSKRHSCVAMARLINLGDGGIFRAVFFQRTISPPSRIKDNKRGNINELLCCAPSNYLVKVTHSLAKLFFAKLEMMNSVCAKSSSAKIFSGRKFSSRGKVLKCLSFLALLAIARVCCSAPVFSLPPPRNSGNASEAPVLAAMRSNQSQVSAASFANHLTGRGCYFRKHIPVLRHFPFFSFH